MAEGGDDVTSGEQAPRRSRWVARAWLSVALIPIVLLGVTYAALVFYRETRYEGAEHYVPEWAGGMPLWAVLLQGLVAVAIVAIPCVAAVWCGRRATSEGDRRGRTPQILGIVALAGYALMILQNIVVGSLG
jgi:hypothetical protein